MPYVDAWHRHHQIDVNTREVRSPSATRGPRVEGLWPRSDLRVAMCRSAEVIALAATAKAVGLPVGRAISELTGLPPTHPACKFAGHIAGGVVAAYVRRFLHPAERPAGFAGTVTESALRATGSLLGETVGVQAANDMFDEDAA